jgi:hypothetical protein
MHQGLKKESKFYFNKAGPLLEQTWHLPKGSSKDLGSNKSDLNNCTPSYNFPAPVMFCAIFTFRTVPTTCKTTLHHQKARTPAA